MLRASPAFHAGSSFSQNSPSLSLAKQLALILFLSCLASLGCACESFAGSPPQCAPFLQFPEGLSFNGRNFSQSELATQATGQLNSLTATGEKCLTAARPFVCAGNFRKCFQTNITLSGSVVAVETPMFPCRSLCDTFVTTCSTIIPASLLPNCSADYPLEGGTMPFFLPSVNTTVDVPCFLPTTSNASVEVNCTYPLVPTANKLACTLRCPFPQYSIKEWDTLWWIMTIGPPIGLLVSVFTAATFLLEKKMHPFPQNINIVIAGTMTLLELSFFWPVVMGHPFPESFCYESSHLERRHYWVNVMQATMSFLAVHSLLPLLVILSMNLVAAVFFQRKTFFLFSRWYFVYGLTAIYAFVWTFTPLFARKYDYTTSSINSILGASPGKYEWIFFWGPIMVSLVWQLVALFACAVKLVQVRGYRGIYEHAGLYSLVAAFTIGEGLPLVYRFYGLRWKNRLRAAVEKWVDCVSNNGTNCRLEFRLSYVLLLFIAFLSWLIAVGICAVLLRRVKPLKIWKNFLIRHNVPFFSSSAEGTSTDETKSTEPDEDEEEIRRFPLAASTTAAKLSLALPTLAFQKSRMLARTAAPAQKSPAASKTGSKDASNHAALLDTDENRSAFDIPPFPDADSIFNTNSTDVTDKSTTDASSAAYSPRP